MDSFASWSERSVRSRVLLAGGLVGIAAFLIAGFVWLGSEEYDVLFTDLEARDAASIVAELKGMNVDYRLERAGRQILVPSSAVHEVRLQLMGSGVALSGTVGFEIFDKSDFGVTEFAQRINYQRALEGELTRTVASLDEVKYARVHLVLPKRGLFRQDDEPPSASITLFLEDEARPDARHVTGIQRLVAAAVPGLSPEQVTVTDQDGLTLSRRPSASDGIAAASGRLRRKKAVERYLSDKVMGVLERAFGPGQAMVSIDVELDLDEVSRTNETVIPAPEGADGVVRRRETSTAPAQSGQDTVGNVTTEVEYRLGRSVEQIVETPGSILRLTVAVMLPADVSEARSAAIRELVAATVGLDPQRGDRLRVHAMPLATKPGVQPLPGEAAPEPRMALDDPSADGAADVSSAPENAGALVTFLDTGGRHVLLVAGLLALALALAITRLYQLRRLVKSAAPPMSEAERDRALDDLKRWLAKADELPQAEGQGA